jgi:hypothetical protein
VVGELLRYLCAINGHERRTGRGLILLCTQKVNIFPGEIVFFLRTVYCSQVSAERRVSRDSRRYTFAPTL